MLRPLHLLMVRSPQELGPLAGPPNHRAVKLANRRVLPPLNPPRHLRAKALDLKMVRAKVRRRLQVPLLMTLKTAQMAVILSLRPPPKALRPPTLRQAKNPRLPVQPLHRLPLHLSNSTSLNRQAKARAPHRLLLLQDSSSLTNLKPQAKARVLRHLLPLLLVLSS